MSLRLASHDVEEEKGPDIGARGKWRGAFDHKFYFSNFCHAAIGETPSTCQLAFGRQCNGAHVCFEIPVGKGRV